MIWLKTLLMFVAEGGRRLHVKRRETSEKCEKYYKTKIYGIVGIEI